MLVPIKNSVFIYDVFDNLTVHTRQCIILKLDLSHTQAKKVRRHGLCYEIIIMAYILVTVNYKYIFLADDADFLGVIKNEELRE